MKKLQLVLKNSIFLVAIFIFISFCYSNNIIDNGSINSSGPSVIKDSRIIVTGDSFAGKFFDFEKNKELQLVPYARAGRTIDDNKAIMAEALNHKEKNVLVSIGVNDQFMETPPYRFEFVLRSLLNISLYNNKNVYFHSYLKYFSNLYNSKKFAATEYDAIIRQLCTEYYNAHYIDVKDLETPYYISDDNIHYNNMFYDVLYSRLVDTIYAVEKSQKG
jgi:lysophospholipase L1-like esterase